MPIALAATRAFCPAMKQVHAVEGMDSLIVVFAQVREASKIRTEGEHQRSFAGEVLIAGELRNGLSTP